MKPLEGLRLLDLTTVVSGPYAASLLADLGADVIKVEPPTGDTARGFTSDEPLYAMKGLSPHIMTLQRNKRGIVIDLRNPAGKAAFDDLVRWADVVLENFRPGVTERLGIDYATLKTINPRVIACSITGYGLTGPARNRAALDACIQAYSGVMGMTGEPGGTPMRAGPLYGDLCSGMAGALGILAAVTARERTGKGQHVDISMLDVQLSFVDYNATMHLMSGLPSPRMGNEHALHVPYNAYPTATGWLFVAIVINPHWPTLVEVLSGFDFPPDLKRHIELIHDPRLVDRVERIRERDALNAAMTALLATQPREVWMEAFAAEGLAFAPVNTIGDALADPQVAAREMIAEIPHPEGGSFRAPGNPIKLSDGGPDAFTAPPLLGQHTEEVLRDVLGYGPDKLRELLDSGAFSSSNP